MQIKKINVKKNNGFTLIEILVVIGIIAVLAAVVLIAINPSRQFKLARDTQRMSNVTAILNAVGQNISEHKGVVMCNDTLLQIPDSQTAIKDTGGIDLAPCLVPDYISSLPFDPSISGAQFTDISHYDTKYNISQSSDGRITISSIGEITPNISVTR